MIQTCKELIASYTNEGGTAHKLIFNGVPGFDVYNIAAPFTHAGQRYIAGRVEKRDSEESIIYFFKEKNELEWELDETLPSFQMQDPFTFTIGKDLLLGGVVTYPREDGSTGWYTKIYVITDLLNPKEWFTGPEGMKDLRFHALPTDELLVLTRPQGELGGRGKIGRLIVPTIASLTNDMIEHAPLFDQFTDEEWGGANAVYPIDAEHVGILGHIANFDDEGFRHYYSMSFVYNFKTDKAGPMHLLAMRNEFLAGPTKRDDLVDVVFSGGLEFITDDKVNLYAGISDAEAQVIQKENPFK